MLRRALPSGARTQKADLLRSEGLKGPKRAEKARSAVLTSGGPKGRSVLSVPDPTTERTT